MRLPLVLLLLVAVPAVLASAAAPLAQGFAMETGPSSSWLVHAVPIPASAWSYDDGWWVLEYDASVQGLAGTSMVEVAYVRDGESFGVWPFLFEGSSVYTWTEVHTSAPPGDDALLLMVASSAPSAWNVELSFGGDPAAYAPVTPLAEGAGAVVEVEARRGLAVGARQVLSLDVERTVATPSWYFGRVRAGADAGAWAYDLEVASGDVGLDRVGSFAETRERYAGLGLHGTLDGTARMRAEQEGRADLDGRVEREEVLIPFDVSTLGASDPLIAFGSDGWSQTPGTPPLGWSVRTDRVVG